ncbi:MFS general substrate transporter, partial [Aspergillus ellipticus CBS 707.79]
VVQWDGPEDLENPHNWSIRYKFFVSGVLVALPLIVNIGTSIMSGTAADLEKEFHIGTEVVILSTTTMFLIGFVTGPLIFGPLSEKYGRRWPILSGVILFATFSIPVAVAQNFYTILICRFFSGAFGASSMAVTGGALTDVWNTTISRGIALDSFVATAFIGPVISPILSNFITQSYLGWRWTLWIVIIAAYSFSVFAVFALPETYAPVLLTAKAGRLRFETKDWALHSKAEEERTNFKAFAQQYLLRPYGM